MKFILPSPQIKLHKKIRNTAKNCTTKCTMSCKIVNFFCVFWFCSTDKKLSLHPQLSIQGISRKIPRR